MVQQFASLPIEHRDHILCYYVNPTPQTQIARIANIPNWYFERVVFPGERLLFEAFPEAELEIYSYQLPTAILIDKCRCNFLRVREQISKA